MDYKQYVHQVSDTFLMLAALKPSNAPQLPKSDAVVLIVAPHPDDECLMGSYALRLKKESGATVHVVPFSLGSKAERQAARDAELNSAIKKLGFQRVPGVAETDVAILALLQKLKPNFLFSPHEHDGHVTHQKTFQACRTALKKYAGTLTWIQTEFWQNIPSPNLLVRLSADHVIALGEALMEHKGEVARNPYHLRLPAWFMDQVRRGSECVGGAGAKAVDAVFGQIYTQIECKGADESKWVKSAAKVV